MRIQKIEARKIINSAGNWTVECHLTLKSGKSASAAIPRGISASSQEKAAVTPEKAIRQIEEEIFPFLVKRSSLNQYQIDQLLLKNPSWGSNATLAVSAAFAKATGLLSGKNYHFSPQIMLLVFEGKKHGNHLLKIQEFMIIVNKIEEGIEFYKKTKKSLEEKEIITTVGSEGGFSPPQFDDEKILTMMKDLGAKKIALDLASNTNPLPPITLLNIVRRYPVASVEDPLPETKMRQWPKLFAKLQRITPEILVVADDLTVTDPQKIKKGAQEKSFNAVVIKPDQQGTITKARQAIKICKDNNLKTIISHRGEETNDSWIVDFALLSRADFIKFGAPSRGERVAKYNRLLDLT